MHFGLFDFDSPTLLSVSLELTLDGVPCATCFVEFLGDLSHFVALPATDVVQLGQASLGDRAMSLDECGETNDRSERPLDIASSLSGLGSRGCVCSETSLKVFAPFAQELLAFAQTGDTHVEILTT